MRIILIVYIILVFYGLLHAQPDDVQQFTDDNVGFVDGDQGIEGLENQLVEQVHRVNLNKADDDELNRLRVLTAKQIEAIILYRKEYGPFVDLTELQAVPGLDLGTIRKLEHLLFVPDANEQINRHVFDGQGQQYLVVRLDKSFPLDKKFTDGTYMGSSIRRLVRYRMKTDDTSIGLLMENDAGEKTSWDPHQQKYLADHISFHVQLIDKGMIRNILMGDFQAQFGQGLVLGGGFQFGKGGDATTSARKVNAGFLPFTASSESGMLRGVATSLRLTPNVYLHTYYSHAKRDGTAADSSASNTLQSDGLHRSMSELAKRKVNIESNMGSVLQMKTRNFDGGLVFQRLAFAHALQPPPSPYNQFAFRGQENMNTSVYINFQVRNLAFFSEVAQTLGAGRAMLGGLLLNVAQPLDVALVWRTYDKDFHSFYASAWGETASGQNEKGMYWGWKFTPGRKINVSGYTDIFRFPWLRYRLYRPSQGYEVFFRLQYTPSKFHALTLQVRKEEKARNVSGEMPVYQIMPGKKENISLHIDYALGDHVHGRTRWQASRYAQVRTTYGSLMLQDISLSWPRVKVSGQFVMFDTDDYDNRQYVFEKDVFLSFTFPAYAGNGLRSIVMMEYKLMKHITAWVRYGHTRYIRNPGSREANDEKDIRFVLRYRS